MIRVKHGAVIGQNNALFCMYPVWITRLWVPFSQSRRRM